MGHLSVGLENSVATVTFDSPGEKVNVLAEAVLRELDETLGRLAGQGGLKALLFASAKPRIFIAGADIREIERLATAEAAAAASRAGQEILNRVEDFPAPTVALLGGTALGGGMEFALACSYRVAAFGDEIRLGLPEVMLGVIPGFGGTWRLPARTGLRKGIELIAEGRAVDPVRAFSAGLVDALAPEALLRDAALEFLEKAGWKKGRNRAPRAALLDRFLESPLGRPLLVRLSRKAVLERTRGHYPAPLRAVEIAAANFGAPRAAAMRREAEAFGALVGRNTHRELIRVFFLTERYKKEPWTAAKPHPVRRCGVVGAGVMGGGIAQLASSAGRSVRMKDVNAEALALGLRSARRLYDAAVRKRRLAAAPADTAMGLILPTLDYSGFGLCDVVIEAVVENMDVKKRVFADLDRAAPRAVLVTNTSSLSVAEMASAVADPSRVAGMHFFNPVHKMPLVEVIRAAKTSDEAVATVVQFSRDLKKTPLVVKDAPGFLVNRVLMALLNEAGWLYEEGTPVADVDRALLGFGLPMGAFLLLDEIGLDIGSKVAHVLSAAFGERMKPSGTLERLVEKKWLGKKSGTGFYLHGRKRPAPNPGLPPPARGGRAAAAEEIVARCIGVMVNEASRCLEEGVVREPADVDLGMILGTGFPPFRGGLLCHADAAGTGRVLADLERFRGATGAARFAPAKLLEDLGRREQPFHASKP